MKIHQEKIDNSERVKRFFFRFLKEENVFNKFIFNYYNCPFDDVFLDLEMWDEDDAIFSRKKGLDVFRFFERVLIDPQTSGSAHAIIFDAFQWDKDPNISWGEINNKWSFLLDGYVSVKTAMDKLKERRENEKIAH